MHPIRRYFIGVNMNYKIVSTTKEFMELKEAWNTLYLNLTDTTTFQSFEWNFAWWNNSCKDYKLFIILFYKHDSEGFTAIFPLMISPRGILHFIADKHSDYSDILIIDNYYETSKTFVKLINNSHNIKGLELKNLCHSSMSYLNNLIIHFDYKQILYQSNASSWLEFHPDDDFFNCFKYLDKKRRKKIRQLYKKNHTLLKSDYIDILIEEFPEEEIVEIVDFMKETKRRGKSFFNDELISIVKYLYKQNLLLIQRVYDKDNTIMSMKFILKQEYKNHYYLWMTIYKDYPQINILSHIFFIEYLCNNLSDKFIIDFCRGLYNYKTTNFLPKIEQHYIFFYSKSNITFSIYLLKTFIKFAIKNFYKRNKTIINKILGR